MLSTIHVLILHATGFNFASNWVKSFILIQVSCSGYIAVNVYIFAAICSKPTIENGSVSPNRTIEEGESYYFYCDDGYTLYGNSTSECGDEGTLSNITPNCTGLNLLHVLLILYLSICMYLCTEKPAKGA